MTLGGEPLLFQTVDKVLSTVFFLGRAGAGKQKRLGQAGPRMQQAGPGVQQAGPRMKLLHRRSIFSLKRRNSEKILQNSIISPL
ncbi:hypothetical protein DOE73_24280 [Paenibacillus dendritiformis]|nr:hypothetical protein DOE73_24280 [Paenibacillus dendritiformis]